ncbi:MAG: deoxyribodipyrimidine photolyase [Pirellulales bacterium]|nr:deoxyribodipyrimidine photolyase [Pirellulales bacterium]
MTASRRTTWNAALERSVELAKELRKSLLIVETLSSGSRWSSDRHHRFILQGMAENRASCEKHGIRYYPFVEHKQGTTADLVVALASHSCAVITDDFPMDSSTAEVSHVARQIGVRTECVDSNGLLPIRATDRVFPTAYAFRRFLQRSLPDHLPDPPAANPLARTNLPRLGGIPHEIRHRWPPASSKLLSADMAALARLPIDHAVHPVPFQGGASAARKTWKTFLKRKLANYPGDRNHPDADGTSGLSAYLHFGHISVHEVFRELAEADGWSPARVRGQATGKREGWWGMSEASEAFLDELVTWREVGFNMCSHAKNYFLYDSLPDWAKSTLAKHAADRREYVYTLEEFEQARTHDRLWNAAQNQLVCEGRMHNYMRMLWGKKILEWSAHPQEALDVMIELNNKYALDGQDPNSYSGIFWVLGRYDRPWGPERPIFGKVRYMSSENTARKLQLNQYLADYAPAGK